MISSPAGAFFPVIRKPQLLVYTATAVAAIFAAVQHRSHDYKLPPHLPRSSRLLIDAPAGMTVSEAPVRALAVPIPKERPTQARDLANALDPIISEASQRFAIPEESDSQRDPD